MTLTADYRAAPNLHRIPHRKTLATANITIDERCRTCANRQNCEASKLLSVLPLHERKQLFRTHVIPKGQHLYYAGDPLDTLAVVKSGLFKTYLNSENGDEKVIGFHSPGEVLGADAIVQFRHSLSTVALESTIVCTASYSRLESLPSNHASKWLLRQVYQEVLRDRNIMMITTRRHSSDAKVALFLLDWSARNQAQGYSASEFKLNIPHRDIAHYLDMAVETVSRVFARLQHKGLLEVHRPKITLTDIPALKKLVEE